MLVPRSFILSSFINRCWTLLMTLSCASEDVWIKTSRAGAHGLLRACMVSVKWVISCTSFHEYRLTYTVYRPMDARPSKADGEGLMKQWLDFEGKNSQGLKEVVSENRREEQGEKKSRRTVRRGLCCRGRERVMWWRFMERVTARKILGMGLFCTTD